MKNQLSPEKYIATKGRTLPFADCYINENWKENGLASIIINKKMPGGNFIHAAYLVDIYCLGLKNAIYKFNVSIVELKEIMEKYFDQQNMIEADVPLLHNIIYGAIDYAEELGFKPHKDFALTEHLLNPELITDGIDDIEFGQNGMPLFIAGPFDNVKGVLAKLNQSVGEGNYHYVSSTEDNWD